MQIIFNQKNKKWKELEFVFSQEECKQMISLLKELINEPDQHFHIMRNIYNEKEINDITISIQDNLKTENKYSIMSKAIIE
jgi:hypothetical protein